jgi:hypothetical protein
MSRRLQVLDETEWNELRRAAQQHGVTGSEWVRAALRTVQHQRSTVDTHRKLEVVRAASRHDFPTGDIYEILGRIEEGYRRRYSG